MCIKSICLSNSASISAYKSHWTNSHLYQVHLFVKLGFNQSLQITTELIRICIKSICLSNSASISAYKSPLNLTNSHVYQVHLFVQLGFNQCLQITTELIHMCIKSIFLSNSASISAYKSHWTNSHVYQVHLFVKLGFNQSLQITLN